jgi:hypothetical protein
MIKSSWCSSRPLERVGRKTELDLAREIEERMNDGHSEINAELWAPLVRGRGGPLFLS